MRFILIALLSVLTFITTDPLGEQVALRFFNFAVTDSEKLENYNGN